MQVVKLPSKKQIPIEVNNVNPDSFAGETAGEIKTIPVWYGNRQCPLRNLFNVNTVKEIEKQAL